MSYTSILSGNTTHFGTDLVLLKTAGKGIKIDISDATFGWRDIIGQIIPRVGGATAPAFTSFRGGNVFAYSFQQNDIIDNITFHIPHDYVPGTDVYIHTHWGHNGTAITGSLVINYYVTYSKGHSQQTFSTEKTLIQTMSSLSASTTPQYYHRIDEIQLSVSTGDTTRLVTNDLEVDGLIMVAIKTPTIPTITGSATSNLPYIFMIDLHYQSTNIATKQKSPSFYV